MRTWAWHVCGLAAISMLPACECLRGEPPRGNGENGSGESLEDVEYPWEDEATPVVATGSEEVHVTIGEQREYWVEYGPIQGGAAVAGEIADRGMTWRQSHGYFYIWGHWLLFETERTRAITWGTSVAVRMLPADLQTGTLEREQIIVRCGRILLMPRVLSNTTFPPTFIDADANGGPTYAIVTVSQTGSVVSLTTPKKVPLSSTEPDPDDVFEFFQEVLADHPVCDQ